MYASGQRLVEARNLATGKHPGTKEFSTVHGSGYLFYYYSLSNSRLRVFRRSQSICLELLLNILQELSTRFVLSFKRLYQSRLDTPLGSANMVEVILVILSTIHKNAPILFSPLFTLKNSYFLLILYVVSIKSSIFLT